jgi:glycerophosphoryl diester phosphodiesterase
MTRKVLIGAVAAVVVASGVFAAGGAGILFQAMFRASGTGAVDISGMEKMRQIVSVKDYGAKGDGTTDDTTAVGNAVTAAGSSGVVQLPCPGTYKTTTRGTLACGVLDLLKPSWDSIVYPIIIGHRGTNSTIAPENTQAAFDIAAGMGIPLETDVEATADGALVLMHDPTTDRTTGTTGSIAIAQQQLADLRLLDASVILPGPSNVFVPQRIPTFAEYLLRYKNYLLLPEIKDELASTGTAMATAIRAAGLQRSVAVQDFSVAGLNALKAVDPSIKTVWTSTLQVLVADAVAQGVYAVFINATNVDAAYVTAMHAAGIKVFVFNPGTSSVTFDAAIATGADGIAAEDPGYGRVLLNKTPTGTTVIQPQPTWRAVSGWSSACSISCTPTVASGYATFSGVVLTGGNFLEVRLPIRTQSTPQTQQISATLQATAAFTSDTTRWMGLHIAWSRDDDSDFNGPPATKTPNGYLFAYRQNGSAELSKVVAGVVTSLATATWNTYTTAAQIPLRVNLTSTAITVTRTDNSQTVTVNNSELGRGGFFHALGSGVSPGINATTIVY